MSAPYAIGTIHEGGKRMVLLHKNLDQKTAVETVQKLLASEG